MRPLTILHTEWSDGRGGQEHRIISEMTGMRKRGHRLLLACRPTCWIGQAAADQGIPVFHLPFRRELDLTTIRALVRLIRRERVDIVSTHSGIDSWTGGIAARLAGAVLVRTRHLNLPLKRHPLNFVHYLPHCVVGCGEVVRSGLIASGFRADAVASIPTGVDFATFRPSRPRDEIRLALGLSPQAFAVLSVGVIRGVKRHEVALRAFAELPRARPDAELVIAGAGPMRSNMEALAKELAIAGCVHFLGHRDDIPDLMAAADCLLLTSRSEGIPQAVTQALGTGVPVVATAVGGVPELIRNGETGLLVPPEDPPATAAALLSIAEDSTLRHRLVEAGIAHAKGHYSLDAMLDATEALYARLLAQRGSVA